MISLFILGLALATANAQLLSCECGAFLSTQFDTLGNWTMALEYIGGFNADFTMCSDPRAANTQCDSDCRDWSIFEWDNPYNLSSPHWKSQTRSVGGVWCDQLYGLGIGVEGQITGYVGFHSRVRNCDVHPWWQDCPIYRFSERLCCDTGFWYNC